MKLFLRLMLNVALLLAAAFSYGQNAISVPFTNGFIGVQGNNAQNADNVQNLGTIGLTNAYFIQNSSTTIFEVQGNDIVGTVRLVTDTGQILDVEGAVVWRVTSGSTLEMFGFIPALTTATINLNTIGGANYVIDANSNFGLRLNSSTYPIVDTTSISGNAATAGLLDALNAYLAEVISNSPSGPVVVTDLTTTDLTPTLSGQVTLGAGESFSVLVNGVVYDTSSGLVINGSNWTLTLPSTPAGTYDVTGVITNLTGYTLSDIGTLTINACADPDVPTITGDVTGICPGSTTTLTITGNLNDATQWAIYTGSCGGTLIGTTVSGTFEVGPVADTTYYIRGEGGCVTPGSCASVTVTLDNTQPISITNSVCEAEGLQWVTWDSVNAAQADGLLYGTVTTTMTHSASGLSTTSSMYNHVAFPAQYNVPNGTTLRNDLAGTFTVNLSEPITDLQVAFSSIGNPVLPVPITFSQPFEVIWANAAVNITSPTSLTGSEGFCILKFPGTYSTLSWDYLANESWMNLAFGANSFNCTDLNLCQGDSVTLTASGGTGNFEWSPSDGLSGTNTASVVASPNVTTTYTVIDPTNPCVDPRTIVVTVDDTAPTAVGQDITVALDASGNATITANDVDNGSFDGCAVSSLSVDVTTFDCTNLGANTVNLSATDSNGNSDSVAVMVTVEDNIPPTAVCQDITIALDATGNATITGSDLDNGSTDNCGVSSFTASTTTFTSANIGTNSVTLTVADSSGNTAVCTATVTVSCIDPDVPTLTASSTDFCSGGFVTINISGNLNDATSWSIYADSCGGTLIGTTAAGAFIVAPSATTTYYVRGEGGCVLPGTCAAITISEDTTGPTAIAQDLTVQLDASGNATIVAGDIDNGSSDNCAVDTTSIDITSFDCTDVGPNTVTLTVTDTNGNSSTATATVTVEDNIDPSAVAQDITVQLDASGNATIVAGDINNGSSDNCGIASTVLDITDFDCTDVGPNTVTMTVTDDSGNTATTTATVTVEDNIDPTAVCQDITVQLDASGNATIVAGDIDNGSTDNCGVSSFTASTTTFTSANIGTNSVTLTVADSSGNTAVCTATVTVEDNIPPTAVCQDFTVQLDATGNATITAADVDNGSSDNNGLPVTLSLDIDSFDCLDLGENTVTLTVTETLPNVNSMVNGSFESGDFSGWTVVENPTPYLPWTVGDGIGSGTGFFPDAAPIDGSFLSYNGFDGNIGEMYISQDITVPNSGGTLNWSENIDYQLAAFGATQDRIYEVQIRDTSNNILEVAYQRVAQAGVFDNDNVWDNHTFDMAAYSSQSIRITFWQQIPENFSGPAKFALDNVEFLIEVPGQSSTCTATVTVEDNIDPSAVAQDITVQLDASGNATIVAGDIDNGSSDNCGIASTVLDITDFDCTDVGPNTVTMTVTDDSGNTATATATVTVEDNIDPTAVAQDITVQLDASGNATIVAGDIDNGSSDNCGIASTVLNITDFDCSDVGANSVTMTVTDVNGNTAIATATVTVEDNIDPTAVTQDITINLDGSGMASIVPGDIDNGSFDNCDVDTLVLDITDFDCTNVGPNTVTLTVTDVNGNSSSETAVVTVVDVTPPVIVCAPDVVTIMDPGVCYAEVFFADAIALDECGIASIVQTAGPVSGSNFTQGVTTIEYTATDVNGNTTVCSFTITIQDTQVPEITCGDDITASNDLALCGADVTVVTPIILDNCSLDPAPVVSGPVTNFIMTSGLLDTPSTVIGLSNSIGGDVSAQVVYNGDWGASFEDFDLRGPDGSQVFFRDNQSNGDCPAVDYMDAFSISEATWNGWITTFGTDLTFTLLADPSVNPICPESFYQLTFTLGNGATLVNDYNGTADASDFYPVGTTTVNWTFTDIGGNVVTCSQDITVTDDEAPEILCVGEPGTFAVTEDFESGSLPAGWDNTALRGTDLWVFDTGVIAGTGGGFPTLAATFDDDAAGPSTDNAVQLTSPAYNMTGAISASLSFDYAYNYLGGNEFFSVEVYDGAAWQEILRLQEDHAPTNTGALDMLPYANANFQVRYTFDDGGSAWMWGVGIDNFQLNYDIPSTPLTIALDANGMATLDVSQLILSVTDNCGSVSTSIGGSSLPGSLSTTLLDNNGGADGGAVYFDVTVGSTDLTLTAIDIHTNDLDAFTLEIYTLEGTYVGNENNASAWTLTTTGSGVSAGPDAASNAVLDTQVTLVAGTTYGMAVVLDATHGHRYTNGDGTNENYSNADLSLSAGAATTIPFEGNVFSPRVFNGGLYYVVGTPASTTIDFDCSNLGDNFVEVTATDAAGNVSTCISTVEIVDVTDPILVCQDATVSLDENGMAEVLPEYFIDAAASFDACGITITAVDVTDVTCADIGASITVTVFVSDSSGNIASCQAVMTVVDDMGPILENCPADMTVDPGTVDLFYEVPDYTAGVTATDNCTDPMGAITQDPVAGTLLPDGVYTVTLSATDNEGNVGTCSFELTVESQLGVASNQLDNGVAIYPNPARNVMNIGNSTNIQLERAAIYDINGRLIQTVDLSAMGTEASVNVAHLASGVYMVQLQAENGQAIKRLVKE